MIRLVDRVLDPREALAAVATPRAGAIVTFDGCVRNHSHDRPVRFLVYEAYAAMAIREMEAIRRQVLDTFPIEAVAILHRLGRLEIGESSVFIAVSAAHRADAFAACREVIDRLKQTVPIWKQEHFEDHAAWVEGDPSHPTPAGT